MRTHTNRGALLLAFVTVAIGSLAVARPANAGVITGQVKGSEGPAQLAGVRIEIPELGKVVITSANGVFEFVDVPDGRYTLRVSVPGKTQVVEKSVEVVGQRVTVAEVYFESSASSEAGTPEIVITGARPTDPARERELEAPNIINVVTADEIRKLPDVSAAEAIRRVPGVSAENDTGEARFINIRGLDADLNGTTFAGVRLLPTNPASPLGGGRAVAFDTIPAGLIGAMTVTKTNTPEMDAEALGGTIEITPKRLNANDPPFVSGRIGTGFEPLRNTWIGDFELAGGTRFGFGDGSTPFSAVGSVAYYIDHRGIDDLEESYVDDQADGVPDKAFNDLQHRYYQLQRKRLGFGGELAYQPSESHRWYLDAYQSGYVEDQNKDYLVISFDGAPTVSPTNPNVLIDTVASYDRVNHDHTETLRARLASVGGRDALGASVLDYRLSYAEGRYIVSKDISWDFQAPGGASISYDNTSLPNWPTYQIGPGGPNRSDPAAYTLLSAPDGVGSGYEHDLDKEVAAVVNLAFPIHLLEGEEGLKFGLSARLRDKTLAPITVNYLASPTISLSQYVNSHFITYYKGHYGIGYDFNIPALEGLYASGVGFVPDTVNNDLANAQSWQQNKEDVYAAYGQYSYTHEELGIIAGVRVEHTNATYAANAFNSDTNTLIGVNTQDSSYTNAFPTFQVRYQVDPTLVARGTISSAIARPGFQQITAAISLSPQSNTITQGNPTLKPTIGYNLDLAVDQSIGDGGVISLGVFDKELRNYITATGYRINAADLPANPIYEGFTGVVDITSYTNISQARVTGTEIAWEQRFKSLPGFLSGLGAGANWTWVNSKGDLRPGRSSALPSTARNTANADLFYDWQHFEAKVAAYYTSRVIFTPNTDDPTGYTDVYQSERLLLDLGTTYTLSSAATLYLNVKNLTNNAMRYTEGPEDRPIQREFYGVTVQAGANLQF